ncbi:arsenate reductase/protein-tyrosine-phosphatase family protein [Sphaerisporangium krabiense]|uniref:Protein-tyrosine-phosphatase/DNA-binding HxlR family transcriptional regulator n=1 Tax=Sphaerisporangium krabiense TaxID=763782 RepID=A0A7W9DUG4_9ACTN|nr:helix-turn-helix domain-containing protein [Sphaerisporangium krabiense]MBB5630400.1 protein-tyrosine-phosphatase/DNA-binding HxlR family transcriptional regulator [Sphaerisporangium krabiense]
MDIEGNARRERVALHHALADPARLDIVDRLVAGDLSPGELGRSLGLPSNLVAHHLRVLENAGLIARTRSHADRRRFYVRLIPSALDALTPGASITVPRVVFVCTRNAARSPLAAALWARRSGIPVTSAGTHPGPRLNPRAVHIARKHGLDLGTRGTAHVRDVIDPADLVVTVCDKANEELTPTPRRAHWSVPDPGPVDTDEIFEEVLARLGERVDRLAVLTTVAGRPPGAADGDISPP